MDKTCIINPATGRAVKIDSRLGKKLSKKETKDVKVIEVDEKKKQTKKSTKVPMKVVKEYPNKDKEDAVKKLQAVMKSNVAKKNYEKDKDFKKAMGEDFSKQKFGKMTDKEKKQSMEKNKKMMEEQNKKLVGDKTAKDVFKIIKDYLDVWNFENYKKSKTDKQKYLIKHQDAWGDVAEIVDAYGKDKLLKTLNQKNKKIFEEYKQQAKLEGTLEQKIILD